MIQILCHLTRLAAVWFLRVAVVAVFFFLNHPLGGTLKEGGSCVAMRGRELIDPFEETIRQRDVDAHRLG
jgi:hypothetical protein